MVTQAQLRQISKSKQPKASGLASLPIILDRYEPHVQAHILAQVMHETGGLFYDREVWGPTKAQDGYEGRQDLGNTQKGDGAKYRGYGLLQLTGRSNVTKFYKWCKAESLNPPDLVAKPELIATSPWAGWSVVWYWEAGNPTKKPLTPLADANNIEMITRRINGGLNGYEDRLHYYDRSALVLLGYKVTELQKFQRANKLDTKSGSGPKTRAALHLALVALTIGAGARTEVTASPIVETVTNTEAVVVTPPSADAPWWKSKETIVPLVSGGGLATATGTLDSVGNIPTANLIVLIVAVFVVAAAVLYILKKKDNKIVKVQAAAINAQSPVRS